MGAQTQALEMQRKRQQKYELVLAKGVIKNLWEQENDFRRDGFHRIAACLGVARMELTREFPTWQ